jgi:hypothetical protein
MRKSKPKQLAIITVCGLVFAALIVIPLLNSTKKNKGTTPPTEEPVMMNAPVFNEDSAYQFIQKQVDFGPRVTNTEGWRNCGNWLQEKLSSYCDTLFVQTADMRTADGRKLSIENYIGSFNPDHPKRIIVCAHWDTRHISDHDPDSTKRQLPIPGADDGGSGVGVALEIARQIHLTGIDFGVDIILFDAEDWGIPDMEDSYCLGSQYWSVKPHRQNYRAVYAILLDLVGGKDSKFAMEMFSMKFAENVVRKVWRTAHDLGYGAWFLYKETGAVADDHYYINYLANIPAIDIIANSSTTRSGFPPYWHTQADDMNIIGKNTLKAVGQTVLQVLYNEQAKPM